MNDIHGFSLLLDPEEMTVASDDTDTPVEPDRESDADEAPPEDDATIPEAPESDTIVENRADEAFPEEDEPVVDPDALERILDDGTDVVLQSKEDITVSDPLSVGGGGSLSITAGGDVRIAQPVTLLGGDFESRGVDFTNTANITTGGGSVSLIHSGDTIILGISNFSSF